jgi:hypothetical protein
MNKIITYLDDIKNNKKEDKRNESIKYILFFYYLFIILMPFELGTASISEMSIYSMWKYYLNEDLILNSNIMLDVEALTLSFDLFYHNFLNKDENNKEYTPYKL